MSQKNPVRFMIMDACVLIDYMNGEPDLFRLISDYIGPIYVVTAIPVEAKEGKSLVRERYYRAFERSFSLPEDIDETAIEGEFSDGVLTITLPKKSEVQPKSIEVKIKSK